jgi:hypothetical protein
VSGVHRVVNRVWFAPLVLGVSSAVGLVAALVSDDLGDWLAWAAVGLPAAVALLFSLRPEGRR